jgi:hypothetical protein
MANKIDEIYAAAHAAGSADAGAGAGTKAASSGYNAAWDAVLVYKATIPEARWRRELLMSKLAREQIMDEDVHAAILDTIVSLLPAA